MTKVTKPLAGVKHIKDYQYYIWNKELQDWNFQLAKKLNNTMDKLRILSKEDLDNSRCKAYKIVIK